MTPYGVNNLSAPVRGAVEGYADMRNINRVIRMRVLVLGTVGTTSSPRLLPSMYTFSNPVTSSLVVQRLAIGSDLDYPPRRYTVYTDVSRDVLSDLMTRDAPYAAGVLNGYAVVFVSGLVLGLSSGYMRVSRLSPPYRTGNGPFHSEEP